MVGPYRILSQIGQGGMATVYKAYHAAMDRYVAVKVLPTEFAKSAQFMGRFQQEARTIANLEHPHILPVHDFGESNGVHYFVMRFLDAGTLKERIETGIMPLAEIDRVFTQLAEALGYAHERGVIHRDIKPSNALIDARGDVFLTDFGIAKLLEGSSQFTTTGTITGTPAYMSPEQAQGEKIDQRSDIYSLGIVLYEMVTGRVPFEAETPLAVILKHVQAPLPLPSAINSSVHPDIERVLLKALAKNRDDRFATCKELLSAWKMAYAAAPYVPAPDGTTVRAPDRGPTVLAASPGQKTAVTTQPAPRQGLPIPLLLGGGAVLAVIVLGAIVVGALFIMRQAGQGNATAAPTQVAGEGTTIVPTALPGSTPIPSISYDNAAFTSWSAGNLIFKVVVAGDRVITGGPGSVTIWNRIDGSIERQVTTASGLPDSDVHTIYVDEDGSVWAGTEGGLVHGNGDEVTEYTVQDGLDSDSVWAISRLRDGRLIVGTFYSGRVGGGLNILDEGGWRPFPDFPSAHPDENPEALSNFVNAILDEGEGGLFWVGTTNGLGRFDGATWTRFSTAEGLPCNNILSLYSDSQGQLIAGTECGVAFFDGATFNHAQQGPPYGVNGIVESTAGRYWFSGGGGVWRYDRDNADWKEFSTSTGDLPTWGMFGAAADADGNVYIGSDGAGLVVFSANGQDISLYSVPNVPDSAALGSILPAPDGALWFGQEYGSWVSVFNPADETWSSLPQELPGFPIAFDSEGRLWTSEWNNGLWIVSGDDQTHFSVEQGLPQDHQVRSVAFLPGETWVATDHGLALMGETSIQTILKAADMSLPSDFVRTLKAASDGSLWVSGEVSLSRRLPDGSWQSFGSGNPFSYDGVQVYDIAEDHNGGIWIATNGDGVYYFANEAWDHISPDDPGVDLPSPDVFSIAIGPDGTVWFGTDNGAALYNGSAWRKFDVSPESLVHWQVNDIYVAADGTAYFATRGGVTRLAP